MAFSDFTLRSVQAAYGLTAKAESLFPDTVASPIPDWLPGQLARGLKQPLITEKARGELLVMPVLMACHEIVPGPLAIYSGAWLGVAGDRELQGECDFVLARSTAVPELTAPLVAVVEAKRGDVEAGLGRCAAQLVGTRLFNAENGWETPRLFGCVTSGEVWLFLRLDGREIVVDTRRRFLAGELSAILGIFVTILSEP